MLANARTEWKPLNQQPLRCIELETIAALITTFYVRVLTHLKVNIAKNIQGIV